MWRPAFFKRDAFPAAGPPKAGDVLDGKYRVERVLGVGGMGYVVAARHAKLGELVALKLLRPDVLRSRDDLVRFLREGRAASKLRSEHVVRILDLGEVQQADGEVPYLVMEHLEGRDLAAVLRDQGPLAVPQVIASMLEACEAIAEAHTLGIVHRDLKPANLFLSRGSSGIAHVKVLDFGISKLEDPSDADLTLTATRTLMGSPVYMAPEAMRSARNADARSDIWALGIILYELLTGVVPFVGETVTELCVRVIEETPRPLSRFRDDVPEGLEGILTRCLAKKPEDRFGSVFELAAALSVFAERGAERLEQIRRVLLAAEQRMQSAVAGASSSGPFPPLDLALDPATTTLRGWGTTRVAPPRRRAVWFVSAAMLLSAIVLVVLLASRSSEPSRSSAAAGTHASAAASVSATAAPSQDLEMLDPTSPSAAPSHSAAKPAAKPKAAGTAKPGHAGKPGPYLADDPN